jgi:hypothetical protein
LTRFDIMFFKYKIILMARAELLQVNRIAQGEPKVKLMIANGSERGDFMPVGNLTQRLGGVHAGMGLMAEYYPHRLHWPGRTLFGSNVPHYRHWYKDQTKLTRMHGPEEGSDGYYAFDLSNLHNDVVQQMEDVRRHGYDPRLTLTADINTPMQDMEAIAEMLKPFGPVEVRLNHEANGNTWFRFAKRVGDLPEGPQRRQLYYEISQFFIRAKEAMTRNASNVQLVACYNGPGERINSGELKPGEYPHLSERELGAMYDLEGIKISIDQYGSLHYGWPGHKIKNPPVIGPVTHAKHQGFAVEPDLLFNNLILPFQDFMAKRRGEPVLLDLGEMNYDRDIHDEDITAYLVDSCYRKIVANPQAIGSVVFYDAADMGGLGLFRQVPYHYGDVTNLSETRVTNTYREIMRWPQFQHPTQTLETVSNGAEAVELVWRSSTNAEGLEFAVDKSAGSVDFKEPYWRRVVFVDGKGEKRYEHTGDQVLVIPPGTKRIQVFALPPDGRDNSSDGFRATVPLPKVTR